jgi:hypothetical protein
MSDLEEIEAIKRLKYKYMRSVDEKSWDELRETLAEDASCAYSGGKYAFDGRDAVMGFLVESMQRDTFLSSHRVTQPEIDLVSDTTATGIWALEDTVIDLQFDITLRGSAFYRDTYVKQGGQWLIQHTGYVRTFEEVQPRKPVEGLVVSQNRWA